MNSVFLSGYMPKQVELRVSNDASGNKSFMSFNLIVPYEISEEKKKQLEAQGKPTADFPKIVAFGKPAETIANNKDRIKKLAITGAPFKTGTYDKADGSTGYDSSIHINRYDQFEITWKEASDATR